MLLAVIVFSSLTCLLPSTLAQSPVPSPAPPPTPTPPLVERHEESFVEAALDLIVKVVGYVITAILGAIALYFLKPYLDRWLERRKLKLQARERERQAQEQAQQRRRIEDERLRAYLDRVTQIYSMTRIFIQDEPVSLEEIYTDVYVLERPEAFRRFDITQLRADPGLLDRAERVQGRDFLARADAHRLFILGKPGAGKTTFLRYLARQAAAGVIDKIPIFVTLREWADADQHSRHDGKGGENLISFIVRQFEICDFPDARPYVEHLLEATGDALVLFDGLDEIRTEGAQRGRAIAELRDFARRYENAQVLITCRVAASDYTFEGFTYVEMADFTDAQIQTFARKYFRHSPKMYEGFLQELDKPEHRGLRDLARTPLLLGLLCLNFEETLTFPRHRDEIYTEALDALLKKWDAKREIRRDQIYRHLSLKHRRRLLAHIAYETFERGDYFIPQPDLERSIVAYLEHLPDVARAPAGPASLETGIAPSVDGEAILRAIEAQHGILVERAHRIHAFAHLTFQEYYTARYIVENVASGTIPRLLSHCTDDRWREVILLTSSLLDNADGFFEQFLHALDDLVRDDAELVAFFDWAARKAASVEADYKPAALRSYYCHLTQVLARARARAFALVLNLDLALDLDLVRDRDLDRVLDFILGIGLAFDFALALDLVRNRDLALDLDLDLTLALALGLARDRNRDLALARDRALATSRQLGLTTLHQALSALAPPPEDGPSEDWRAFGDGLQAIMIEHRDSGHDWAFTEEQVECLRAYFYAVRVLVECLDLAYVTDRAAIEDRLLLPPTQPTQQL